jgi:hypothetical protein
MCFKWDCWLERRGVARWERLSTGLINLLVVVSGLIVRWVGF